MGLGNGNPNSGNKGSNHNFEHRQLISLNNIFQAITTGGAPAPAGVATEATLLSVLNSIVASQDLEILLVRDTGAADIVIKQLTEYDIDTGTKTVTYETVDGTPYVPVGPLKYLDPSAVLNLILAELQTLNANAATEITLDALLTAFNAEDFATQTTLKDLEVKFNTLGQKLNATSTPVTLSSEQEAILDAIKTATESINIDTDGLALDATVLATNVLLTTIDAVLDNIKVDTGAMVVDLAAIEVLLTGIDAVLDNIKLDTANLDVLLSTRASETTLADLNTKLNTLGQKLSADSAPVVLSTEQELILNNIKTAIDNIDINIAGDLNLEATQLLVKAVLDSIKLDTAGILTNTADIEALLTTIDADTSNIDVLLSTRATEATLLLVKGVLDNIKLDTAAIDTNTDGLEALLTTIDAVLDAIKLDTANLDVALSTRATEATLLSVLTELQGINLDTNGLSQEATQLLVKGVLDTIDAVLDSIKLDTGAMVVDLAAIEVLITTTNSLLTTIDGVLDAIKVDTGTIAIDTSTLATPVTGLAVSLIESSTTGTVAAGKRKVSIHNRGGAAADIAGGTNNLAPGLSVTFSAEGLRDTLAEIAYDGTGTILVISTIG